IGNLCSSRESIREMRIGIGELRNDIARQVGDREMPEVQASGERTTAHGSGSSRICGQTTAATRRDRPVGRHRNSKASTAAEEFVARARRSRN
ncbi:hypothetical protein HOY80DRAFT_885794, partial [Tuber brumale]